MYTSENDSVTERKENARDKGNAREGTESSTHKWSIDPRSSWQSSSMVIRWKLDIGTKMEEV